MAFKPVKLLDICWSRSCDMLGYFLTLSQSLNTKLVLYYLLSEGNRLLGSSWCFKAGSGLLLGCSMSSVDASGLWSSWQAHSLQISHLHSHRILILAAWFQTRWCGKDTEEAAEIALGSALWALSGCSVLGSDDSVSQCPKCPNDWMVGFHSALSLHLGA